MTNQRRQLVKLGIFVVSVVTILALALLFVGGLRLGRSYDTYHVVTSGGVSGIDVDSEVTLRGVEVGKVSAIELDRSDFGRVTIDLAIEPGVAIPATAKAYFERDGLTGQRSIDITGGTLADGQLPPGSTIPRGETPLDALESSASALGDELTALVADARQVVQHTQAVITAVDPERVAAIVEAVDPERVEAIVAHTERAVKTLESTSKQLAGAVSEGRTDLDELTHSVEAVADRATTTLDHVDGASAELSRVLAAADSILSTNEDDISAIIDDLRRVARDTRVLVRALRMQPSLLLRSAPPKERELP